MTFEETFHTQEIQERIKEKIPNTDGVSVEPMECVSCEILDSEEDKELSKNSDFEISSRFATSSHNSASSPALRQKSLKTESPIQTVSSLLTQKKLYISV